MCAGVTSLPAGPCTSTHARWRITFIITCGSHPSGLTRFRFRFPKCLFGLIGHLPCFCDVCSSWCGTWLWRAPCYPWLSRREPFPPPWWRMWSSGCSHVALVMCYQRACSRLASPLGARSPHHLPPCRPLGVSNSPRQPTRQPQITADRGDSEGRRSTRGWQSPGCRVSAALRWGWNKTMVFKHHFRAAHVYRDKYFIELKAPLYLGHLISPMIETYDDLRLPVTGNKLYVLLSYTLPSSIATASIYHVLYFPLHTVPRRPWYLLCPPPSVQPRASITRTCFIGVYACLARVGVVRAGGGCWLPATSGGIGGRGRNVGRTQHVYVSSNKCTNHLYMSVFITPKLELKTRRRWRAAEAGYILNTWASKSTI